VRSARSIPFHIAEQSKSEGEKIRRGEKKERKAKAKVIQTWISWAS
jgi:hypothetical protein